MIWYDTAKWFWWHFKNLIWLIWFMRWYDSESNERMYATSLYCVHSGVKFLHCTALEVIPTPHVARLHMHVTMWPPCLTTSNDAAADCGLWKLNQQNTGSARHWQRNQNEIVSFGLLVSHPILVAREFCILEHMIRSMLHVLHGMAKPQPVRDTTHRLQCGSASLTWWMRLRTRGDIHPLNGWSCLKKMAVMAWCHTLLHRMHVHSCELQCQSWN